MKSEGKNLKAEVVIIGGGGAGMAAALTAAERGCSKVVVLEKVGSPGGNSALAHDLFAVESPVQKQMGTDARRDDFFKIAMRWCHWSKVNPRIVRAFLDKSGETIGWLLEKGVTFQLGQYYINQSPRVRHAIDGRGAELMRILAKECEERGVQVFTRTPGKKILYGKNGREIVVVAENAEGELRISAKSVIITTGGYAGNVTLLKKYCAYYNPETMLNAGVRHNTGDGIELALQAGAATAGLGHIMFHGPHAPLFSEKEPSIDINTGKGNQLRVDISKLVWEPQTLWVNKRGRRYNDEGHNLSSFASAFVTAQQPGGIMYSLFDDSIRQNFEAEGLRRPAAYGRVEGKQPLFNGVPLPGLGAGLREMAKKYPKNIKIAETLDEITEWIGSKPEVLKETVKEYNEGCKRGYDQIFCKDRIYLLPLLKAPYYAVKGQSFICDAIGGIKINEKMEVVDADDNPLPGLYAAGATTGCWESENYCYELTGHLLGFALNSGRIAGENAVKHIAVH